MNSQQTEIGACPAHWEVVRLHEVAELKHGYQFRTHDFTEQGVKVFKITQIQNDGSIDLSSCSYIDASRLETFQKYIIDKGDILMALSGATIGKIGRFKSDEIVLQNYRVGNFIPTKSEKLDKDFFHYFLTTENTFFQILANQNQSAQENVGKEDIHKMLVFLPPLDEQTAIASILSSLDNKIDLLHRQNATLEKMAETLFRQWFMEEAKEEWETMPLSQMANFLNGLACQKFPPKNEIDKLPVLKIKELSSGITENSDWASTDIKPEYFVRNGDVIFAWSASLMVKIWDGRDCILNQHLFKVTSEDYPKWFYYLWCKHHLAEFISIAASHATTMGHIKRGDLDEANVLIPSPEELAVMTEQAEPLIYKIIANNIQINTLTKLRDSLLPKLMSGEVKVEAE